MHSNKFSIRLALTDAWNLTFGRGWSFILIFPLFLLIILVSLFLQKNATINTSLSSFIVAGLSFIIFSLLYQTALRINQGRNFFEKPTKDWFLNSWRPIAVLFMQNVLSFWFIFLLLIATLIISNNMSQLIGGQLISKILVFTAISIIFGIFLLSFIILNIKMHFLFIGSLDFQVSVKNFISKSWSATKGQIIKLLVFYLLYFLFTSFLTILTLGFAIFIFLPFTLFIHSSIYLQLTDRRKLNTSLDTQVKHFSLLTIILIVLTIIWVITISIIGFSLLKGKSFVFGNNPGMYPHVVRGGLYLEKSVKDISELQHADIIFFNSAAGRVIGLPGDKIEFKNRKVLRNDSILLEDYLLDNTTINPNFSQSEYLIADNQVFVLSDERYFYTTDSRSFGPIDFQDVSGVKASDCLLACDNFEDFKMLDSIRTNQDLTDLLDENSISIRNGFFVNGTRVLTVEADTSFYEYPKFQKDVVRLCQSLQEIDKYNGYSLTFNERFISCKLLQEAMNNTNTIFEAHFHAWLNTLPYNLRNKYDDLRINLNFAGSPNELRAWEELIGQYSYAPFYYGYGQVNQRLAVQASGTTREKYLAIARENYLKAIELDPDYVLAHSAYAYVNWRLEKENSGYQDIIEKALSIEPKWSGLYNIWAIIEEERGNTTQAHELYKQAITSNPKYPQHEGIKEEFVCFERRSGLNSDASFYEDYAVNRNVDTILCDKTGSRTRM